jgi:hypothetical protein
VKVKVKVSVAEVSDRLQAQTLAGNKTSGRKVTG